MSKKDPTFPPDDADFLGVGDTLELARNPPRFTLEHFRRLGPVFSTRILNRRPCFLAGVEGMKHFYDESYVVRLPAGTERLMTTVWAHDGHLGLPPLDAPRHRVRKANFLRTTTWEKVDEYLGLIDRRLRETFESWAAKERLCVAEESNRAVLSMFAEVFFSTPFGGRQQEMVDAVVDNFAVFNTFTTIDLPFTVYGKSKDAANEVLFPFFQQVLDEHRAHPERYDDAVSAYLEGSDAETFSDVEILTDFQQYFIGGYGVAGAIPLLVHSLSHHPDVVQRLRDEIAAHREVFDAPASLASLSRFAFADQVIRELVRYWPMVPLVIGEAVREIPMGDYVVPEGSQVFACLYASCHDEALYRDPDRFDPDRFSAERGEGAADLEFASYQVAFGAGDNAQTHKCGGIWVALTSLKLAALYLADNWCWEMKDPDAEIDMGNIPVLIEDGLILRSV